jgi:RNA polymerase sigma factor (sigma-70 family)
MKNVALKQVDQASVTPAALRLADGLTPSAGFHIVHPLFQAADAERQVFGKDGVAGPLPGRSGTVLTPADERALFIQYNYCRFRVARAMAVQQTAPASTKRQRDMMGWHRAALDRRNRLIECNLGLVAMMIRHFRTESADSDELVSEGNLTLLYAVDKFDVERGFRFSTYACQAIHHAMMQAAARRGRRPWTSISEGLDIVAESDDSDGRPFVDDIRQVHEIIHRNEMHLSEVELKVIRSRFALPTTMVIDSRLDPMTREQVGRLIGVSKERIRQIERNALSKLRGAFAHLNLM